MKEKYFIWLKKKRANYGVNFLVYGGFINTVKVIMISLLTKLTELILLFKK